MAWRTVCILGTLLALASASQGYEVEIVDEAGIYTPAEYTYGTSHDMFASAHHGDDGGAECYSTVQIFVTGSEYGEAAAAIDGYTTIHITNYNPSVDPPIHLEYRYGVGVFAIFEVTSGAPPASGSGSGQAHAYFSPGGYRTDVSASYSGLDDTWEHDSIEVENYNVNLSYNGAWFETYGFSYADTSVSVENTTSEMRGWSGASVSEYDYVLVED